LPDTTAPGAAGEAVDTDVDLHVSAQRREFRGGRLPVLTVIAAGGVLGATARHALTLVFRHPPGGFAWSTFAINVSGCALIGVLMVLIEQVWTGRRLLRPFLGVGVLGGFTTFSSYVLDVNEAVSAGAPRTALIYLAATPVAALVAVWAAATATRWLVNRRPVRRHQPNAKRGEDEA